MELRYKVGQEMQDFHAIAGKEVKGDLIVMGDFNIHNMRPVHFRALTNKGLQIPGKPSVISFPIIFRYGCRSMSTHQE
jgi:hypothetical protein